MRFVRNDVKVLKLAHPCLAIIKQAPVVVQIGSEHGLGINSGFIDPPRKSHHGRHVIQCREMVRVVSPPALEGNSYQYMKSALTIRMAVIVSVGCDVIDYDMRCLLNGRCRFECIGYE